MTEVWAQSLEEALLERYFGKNFGGVNLSLEEGGEGRQVSIVFERAEESLGLVGYVEVSYDLEDWGAESVTFNEGVNSGLQRQVSAVADWPENQPKLFARLHVAPATPLLDIHPGAAAAFSLDRLCSDADYVIRVRRDLDDEEIDLPAENLESALADFCGSGNGFLVKWYDQSGNGRHLVQNDPAEQRQVFASGTPVELDGNLAIGGGSVGYDFVEGVPVNGEFSVVIVAELLPAANFVTQGLLGSATTTGRLRYRQDDILDFNGIDLEGEFVGGGRAMTTVTRRNDGLVRLFQHGLLAGSGNQTGSFTWVKALSRNSDVNPFLGKAQELIIFPTDLDVDRTAVEEAIYQRYLKRVPVFVMFGQSNMQGRDADGTTVTDRSKDGMIYEYRNRDGVVRRRFSELYGADPVQFGPNVGLGRRLAAAAIIDVHIIRFGVGGHILPAFMRVEDRLFSPADELPRTNQGRWEASLDFYQSAVSDMRRRHFVVPETLTFVWYQGAEDSKYGGAGSYPHNLSGLYEAHLTRYLESVRNSFPGFDQETQVVIIRSPDWNANTPDSKKFQDVVRAAQTNVAEADPFAVWIDSDAPGGVVASWEDGSHIDAVTQERLGIEVADAWLELP